MKDEQLKKLQEKAAQEKNPVLKKAIEEKAKALQGNKEIKK